VLKFICYFQVLIITFVLFKLDLKNSTIKFTILIEVDSQQQSFPPLSFKNVTYEGSSGIHKNFFKSIKDQNGKFSEDFHKLKEQVELLGLDEKQKNKLLLEE